MCLFSVSLYAKKSLAGFCCCKHELWEFLSFVENMTSLIFIIKFSWIKMSVCQHLWWWRFHVTDLSFFERWQNSFRQYKIYLPKNDKKLTMIAFATFCQKWVWYLWTYPRLSGDQIARCFKLKKFENYMRY